MYDLQNQSIERLPGRRPYGLGILGMLGWALLVSPATPAGISSRCEALTGQWEGTGTFTIKRVQCTYASEGSFVGGMDFHGNLLMTRIKGLDIFCPLHQEFPITGTCNAEGVLRIKNNYADIQGPLAADNQSAVLTGTIWAQHMGSGKAIVHINRKLVPTWQSWPQRIRHWLSFGSAGADLPVPDQ